jgi:hypothetical protein
MFIRCKTHPHLDPPLEGEKNISESSQADRNAFSGKERGAAPGLLPALYVSKNPFEAGWFPASQMM